MLRIMKQAIAEELKPTNNPCVINDIIVNKKKIVEEYTEDGKLITYEEIKRVNLSKKIKESSKLLKIDNAQQKLKELEQLLSK